MLGAKKDWSHLGPGQAENHFSKLVEKNSKFLTLAADNDRKFAANIFAEPVKIFATNCNFLRHDGKTSSGLRSTVILAIFNLKA